MTRIPVDLRALLPGLLLLLLSVSCGKKSAPPPPLPEPKLRRTSGDGYSWTRPGVRTQNTARVIFENGTGEPFKVKLSHGAEFEVPAGKRVWLQSGVKKLDFTVHEAGTEDAPAFSIAPQKNHLYLYNHKAAWDYRVETAVYSTALALSSGSGSPTRIYRGRLWLHLFGIDLLFEPFPESQEVQTSFGIGGTSLTRLVHDGDQSHLDRRVRFQRSEGGGSLALVVLTETQSVLQPLAAIWKNPETELVVDNTGEKNLVLNADGLEIGSVPSGGVHRLRLPEGKHRFRVAEEKGNGRDEVEATLEDQAVYVWSPGGRREFEVEYTMYGTFPSTESAPPSVRLRGLGFFKCPVEIAFEPFPKEWHVGHMMGTATVGRLIPRRTGDMSNEVFREMEELEGRARRELSGEANKIFRARAPEVDRARATEFDLMLLKAAFSKAKGDLSRATEWCDRIIRLQGGGAQAHLIRGLVFLEKEKYAKAEIDFTRAMELDPELKPEVSPLLKRAVDAKWGK